MKITIRYDGDQQPFDGTEYRVPGPDGSEAQACYTDDQVDAIDTCRAIYGANVNFRIKRVACADPDMEYHRQIERQDRDNMI